MPLTRRQVLQSTGLLAAAGRVPAGATPLAVDGKPVELVIDPVSRHTVRISVLALENGKAQPINPDGSLLQARHSAQARRLRAVEATQATPCGELTVQVTAEPLTLRIEARGKLVQELRFTGGKAGFRIGDAPVLGMGEGGPQFDRRGSHDIMRSGQGGYRLRTHGGRVPIQWLIGTAGWAMLVHRPYGTFDLTGKGGVFQAHAAEAPLPLDLFIVDVAEPPVAMAEYARLTGRPEMPPLWSLGYQQSHRTLASREEVVGIVKTFREKKLPCDAVIYLGTGFCPSGWNTANGSFAWNRRVFDDPDAVLRELHEHNVKVVVHVVVLSRRLLGTVAEACDWKAYDEEAAGCYWHTHRKVFAQGVDGWWPDEGDPFDAPSRLRRIRMYYEGSQLDRPNERPYALHRNGHAGMQRYGAFLWSGDVTSTWDTLKAHVPVAINTALTGIHLWGTDIGGFVPSKEFTGELYARWFQFGAFCPLFRSHGRAWKLRLPWGWNTGETGPTEISGYGEAVMPPESELRNPRIEPVCRKYLELRYRLMPYLYSAVRQAHDTGLPIVRALWLHYPDDPRAVATADQYMWGRDILVAPVTEKGATSRAVYLPRGTWYDFWTNERVEGGGEISRPVDLETMPLYVRAGAVLPLGPMKQYTSEVVDAPTTITIYPGADGAFSLYEDDGKSFNYRLGEWTRTEMAWHNASRTVTLQASSGTKKAAHVARTFQVRMAGQDGSREVRFRGRRMEVRL